MKTKTTKTIQSALPQALQTLAHPTRNSPTSTSLTRARNWLLGSGCGWLINGTKEEAIVLTEAFDKCVQWFAEWLDGMEPRWIVLVGVSGTGKTMLARRIADYVANYGMSVFDRTVRQENENAIYSYWQERGPFVSWRDIVPYGMEQDVRLKYASTDWFKVVDDLKPQTGSEIEIDGHKGVQPKRFEVTAAGDLLDSRLRKWTVITSNLTRSQLAIFWDTRIASRLTRDGNEIIDLSSVRDYQLRK